MIVRELSREASWAFLARHHVGRLACAKGGQPYVCPISYATGEDGALYSVTTIGQKVAWMRVNPLIALEVDDVQTLQQWESVIVTGRFEEIPSTDTARNLRERAWSLLHAANPLWWEPGFAETHRADATHPPVPLYFRIWADRITGRHATPS
jgi:nitroimidazol reductase NimA-like FMN-containing flavoprotein (pyridoxamine 5'-phosphate oxidase superfamily)